MCWTHWERRKLSVVIGRVGEIKRNGRIQTGMCTSLLSAVSFCRASFCWLMRLQTVFFQWWLQTGFWNQINFSCEHEAIAHRYSPYPLYSVSPTTIAAPGFLLSIAPILLPCVHFHIWAPSGTPSSPSPSATPVWSPVCWNGLLLGLEEDVLGDRATLWGPLLARAVSGGTLPSRALNKMK